MICVHLQSRWHIPHLWGMVVQQQGSMHRKPHITKRVPSVGWKRIGVALWILHTAIKRIIERLYMVVPEDAPFDTVMACCLAGWNGVLSKWSLKHTRVILSHRALSCDKLWSHTLFTNCNSAPWSFSIPRKNINFMCHSKVSANTEHVFTLSYAQAQTTWYSNLTAAKRLEASYFVPLVALFFWYTLHTWSPLFSTSALR